jgi:hypothetical protein
MAEAFFVGMLPLEHSSTVADPLMERAVEVLPFLFRSIREM